MVLQITGVRKDTDDEIIGLCGAGWSDTADVVIRNIESGSLNYYVMVDGSRADVKVVPATLYQRTHLRTTADTTTKNNLDYLPMCR